MHNNWAAPFVHIYPLLSLNSFKAFLYTSLWANHPRLMSLCHCHEAQQNRYAPTLSMDNGWSTSVRDRLLQPSVLKEWVLWVHPIRKIKIPPFGRKRKSYCNKNLPFKKLFLKNLFNMYQRIKLHPSGEMHVKLKNCIKQQTTSIVLLAANKEMLGVSTGRASLD